MSTEAFDRVAAPFAANRLASTLRGVGGFVLALSGVVFMLQGLDEVALDLRRWAYVLVVTALGGVGVFVRMVLQDAKSARLCFALAAGALVAQVAQLGGMVHELMSGGSAWASFAGTTFSATVAGGVITALLLLPVSFMAFAVLLRPAARTLTFVQALSASLLLLPMRGDGAALMVLAVMAAVWLLAERRLLVRWPQRASLEGRAARALLALPLLVASVRHGFHLTNDVGVFLMALVSSVAVGVAVRVMLKAGVVQDLVMLACALVGSISLAGLVALLIDTGAWAMLFTTLPVALAYFALARGASHLGVVFRAFGLLALALVSLIVLFDTLSWPHAMGLVCLGLGVTLYAVLCRDRFALMGGVTVALLGTIGFSVVMLAEVTFNAWAGLAVAGLVLVVAAAALERYGSGGLPALRQMWRALAGWR